ncbi:uncharacterized protein (DUF2062 family) [Sphingobium sp. B12D2B]|nr:uncharacterized protein (DUF2062 family) [Sphingobium sp. B12D2B]
MKRWLISCLPTRESLLSNRWMKPFAHRIAHPLLWHFNRRSTARGVALGLFAGFLIPFGQTPVAAMLAFSARANILTAACATLVTNPLTFPPIYFAAYKLGHGVLGDRLSASGDTMIRSIGARALDFAAPTALGLLLFAIVASILGFCLVHLGWRGWVAHRWRQRGRARQGDSAVSDPPDQSLI